MSQHKLGGDGYGGAGCWAGGGGGGYSIINKRTAKGSQALLVAAGGGGGASLDGLVRLPSLSIPSTVIWVINSSFFSQLSSL